MRTMHLFAGIGGGILASEILGHESICAVEQDAYRCQVLRERQSDGYFKNMWIHQGDIREFCGYDFEYDRREKMDCITAGFPCQDISVAGRGKGIKGPASGLVSEVFRLIDEVNPAFIFLENSPAIRTRGRKEIIREIVSRGYSWRDGTLAASEVGAPHIRKRWWLLATNNYEMWKLQRQGMLEKLRGWISDGIEKNNAPDIIEAGFQRGGDERAVREQSQIQKIAEYTGLRAWNETDVYLRGMVHGNAVELDKNNRIRALGDAQVPLQAALAFALLLIG